MDEIQEDKEISIQISDSCKDPAGYIPWELVAGKIPTLTWRLCIIGNENQKI